MLTELIIAKSYFTNLVIANKKGRLQPAIVGSGNKGLLTWSVHSLLAQLRVNDGPSKTPDTIRNPGAFHIIQSLERRQIKLASTLQQDASQEAAART